ncbi:MAG: hypothetical protein RL220_238 [Bacteroidota bacterium]
MKAINLGFVVISMIILSGCAFQSETADLIVHNAVIYTVDDNFSVAEAMAIKDGRILEVGAERAILNKYTASVNIDAGKKFIYPGFIDAHCHFLGYGKNLMEANLMNAKSWNEVVQRVKEHAPASQTQWILGRGWNQEEWEIREFPDRTMLDSLFPDRPVFLQRIDGHAAIANGQALKLAGITSATQVAGGEVALKNGVPTGLLVDNAMTLVEDIIPEYNQEQLKEALLRAQANCFAAGLTTVDDAGLMHDEIELIRNLQESGNLKMRIYAMLSDDPENYDVYLARGIDTTSERLTVRSFKFYADGALGSRGACLLQPYEDLPSTKGFLLSGEDHFRDATRKLHDAGFQVNTHAIGDSANRIILKVYGEMLQGSNDRRWRIEHAQVVHKADLNSFGRYNIIPSVQPVHATSDRSMALLRLGRNRISRGYAYRELKEQIGLLALGTDFPVEDISPLATYRSAVFRRTSKGQEPFLPDNALTPEEALRGMTIWAAISNFEENKKGSLEAGKYADFIMLNRDLLKSEISNFEEIKVLSTYVSGERVYSRED